MECFIRDAKEYTGVRDINMLRNWKKHTAFYLSVKKDIPQSEAESFLEWGIKNKRLDFNDPILKIFRRDENGDRHEDVIRASQYLKEVTKRNLVMAPTLTCYLPYKQKPSKLGKFTWREFTERKRIKKEGQIAKSYGRLQEATDKGNQQNKKKEGINSISGALTIGSNPICNRSGHSTLTSICRTATAFANANAERLLLGRRYFPDGPTVLENICAILADVDMKRGVEILNKYQFHLVTPEELLSCLKYSYDNYWRSDYWEEVIRDFVYKLTPEQCSVYLYMGDFYHLRKFNEDYVRNLIDDMHRFNEQSYFSPEATETEFKDIDEFYAMFVASMVAGDVGKLSIFADEHKDKPYFGKIGAASAWVRSLLMNRMDYFDFYWRNKYVPAETAVFPDSIRQGVLGGDTDSVFVSLLDWAKWYHGTTDVFQESKVTSQFVLYLLCMIIKHTLAMTSGQMGVDEKYIFMLKMKNEFFFDSFSPSNRTKHYANIKSACEGLNYTSPELEVKGVALKNSKAPQAIMDGFNDKVQEILEDVAKGKEISMKGLITHVAKIEASIFESCMHGDVDYLPSRAIKVKEAYSIPMSSDYANHVLWEEVFADKYGKAPELPYEGVRIAMNLPNKTAVNIWLDSLQDQQLANRFRAFMESTNRKSIASIILPYETIAQAGIPDEIKPIIDARKIIYSSTEPYYILLEMLSNYMVNKWLTKMCLDERVELIRSDLRAYFDTSMQSVDLDEIRRKTKHLGEEYEEWDNNRDGDDDIDIDEDNPSIFNDDEEDEE